MNGFIYFEWVDWELVHLNEMRWIFLIKQENLNILNALNGFDSLATNNRPYKGLNHGCGLKKTREIKIKGRDQ